MRFLLGLNVRPRSRFVLLVKHIDGSSEWLTNQLVIGHLRSVARHVTGRPAFLRIQHRPRLSILSIHGIVAAVHVGGA